MCHAAVTELLKDDLSPFHCPKDPDQTQEGEEEVVCECRNTLHIFMVKQILYIFNPFL